MNLFEITNRNIFYHYSTDKLELGSIIKSRQQYGQTYNLVWKNYNIVCLDINNRQLFKNYGYAYPIRKNFKDMYEYVVTTTDFLSGNFDYSLYVTMDRLKELTNRQLPLEQRLIDREKQIQKQARIYFTKLDDTNKIEIISSSFKILKINSKSMHGPKL